MQVEDIRDLNLNRFGERVKRVGEGLVVVFNFFGDGVRLLLERALANLFPKEREAHAIYSTFSGELMLSKETIHETHE